MNGAPGAYRLELQAGGRIHCPESGSLLLGFDCALSEIDAAGAALSLRAGERQASYVPGVPLGLLLRRQIRIAQIENPGVPQSRLLETALPGPQNALNMLRIGPYPGPIEVSLVGAAAAVAYVYPDPGPPDQALKVGGVELHSSLRWASCPLPPACRVVELYLELAVHETWFQEFNTFVDVCVAHEGHFCEATVGRVVEGALRLRPDYPPLPGAFRPYLYRRWKQAYTIRGLVFYH